MSILPQKKKQTMLKYKKGYYSRQTHANFNSNETDAFLQGARVQVRSSNVDWVWWEESSQTLFIQFKNGAIYQYPGFDRPAALGFAIAPSKGGYVWDWIRDRGVRA